MSDAKDVKQTGASPAGAATAVAAAAPSAAVTAPAAAVPASVPRVCALCASSKPAAPSADGTSSGGSGTGSMKRCGACKAAWYCSADCQAKHWPEHKRACAPALNERVASASLAGDASSAAFAAEAARHAAELTSVTASYTAAIAAIEALATSPDALSVADRAILARLHTQRGKVYSAAADDDRASADFTAAVAADKECLAAYGAAAEHALVRQLNFDAAMKFANAGLALAPATGPERAALQAVHSKAQAKVYAKQLRESGHGARAAYTRQSGCPTFNFAVVVVQHPTTGKFLAVKETRNRGWWLPAGFVDPGEGFVEAAHRETLEEAGIKVTLKGVLRVEHSLNGAYNARMRVVFYAHPTDPNAPPKSVADSESECAVWVTVSELESMSAQRVLRGDELLVWSRYLTRGGAYYPMTALAEESDEPAKANATASAVVTAAGGASAASSGGGGGGGGGKGVAPAVSSSGCASM